MIVYLDASALVKRYVAETVSAAVGKLIDQAEALGTSVISRAEVSAAFAKAVRLKFVTRDAAASAMKQFAADWPHFIRLQLTEIWWRAQPRSPGSKGCEAMTPCIWQRRWFGTKLWAKPYTSPLSIDNSGKARKRPDLLPGRRRSPNSSAAPGRPCCLQVPPPAQASPHRAE